MLFKMALKYLTLKSHEAFLKKLTEFNLFGCNSLTKHFSHCKYSLYTMFIVAG